MTKRWMLCLLLAGAVTGCRTLEARPTPQTCPEPGPVPGRPPVTPLAPGMALPEGSTHIVVGFCPQTGKYLGAGVDTVRGKFPFAVQGDLTTRELFLATAFRAGVPVLVYTSAVRLPGSEETYDPCSEINTEIGDRPPQDPEDTGGANPLPPRGFTETAWRSAHAVDGASDPAPGASTVPPTRTDVPR